jgi:hypothetical protein
MPVVFFTILLALVLAFAVYAIVTSVRRYQERTRAGWSEAARRLGGRFEPKVGPWYNRKSQLRARLDDQEILVDHYTVSTGQTSVTYTRCTAPVDFAGDLEITVYPKGFWSKVGEGLGTQDVKTGDAAFDEAYMVKARNDDRARAFLSPEVRAAIARLGDYRFTLEAGELKAVKAVFETDPRKLEALGQATAVVARRGQQLRRFWTQAAAARGGTVEATGAGKLRIAIDGSSPVRIESRTEKHQGASEIIARRLGAEGERFVVSHSNGDWAIDSDQPELTRRRISPEIGTRLDRLGPLRIEADREELRIVAPSVEGNAERLAEIVALAEELAAADPRGAYR